MLPLQTTRIYDYQQPSAETPRQELLRAEQLRPDQISTENHQMLEERRRLTDRRATERREKQQAIFLNTRKIQGRRRSAGRRLSDNLSPYRPISLKG